MNHVLKAIIVGTTYEREIAAPLALITWEPEDVSGGPFHACHERED